MLTAEELKILIKACCLNNRESQKKIYSSFYGYAIAICQRYTNRQEDAIEILNDGFLKIFKEIKKFKPAYSDVVASFKGWLGRIMVYTAIDHNRKYLKHELTTSLNGKVIEMSFHYDAIDKMSYEEIIKTIQDLPPAYRTVFNLYVIEGFSHDEIAKILSISSGTSKSNLSKAKKHLQKKLINYSSIISINNAV